MTDKNYCMSSYLAFRYIERPDADFYPGMHHRNFVPVPDSERIPVASADEIDRAISAQLERLRGRKAGIMLSGGMDSAIVASYMRGCDAYTFRSSAGNTAGKSLRGRNIMPDITVLSCTMLTLHGTRSNAGLTSA